MAKVLYDRQEVINETTNLFWKSGYYATSMQTLFQVTGLKPGSIYLAFGNKESLFKLAVDNYTETALTNLRQVFNEQGSVGKSICCILQMFTNEIKNDNYNSCFLVKSQLELGNDIMLKNYVSKRLMRLEQLYAEQLLSLYRKAEAEEKAASIMLHIFGICVYGNHNKDANMVMNSLQSNLSWLPWEELNKD